MAHSRIAAKECIRAFKIIQHIMGDRDAPVENVSAIPISTAGLFLSAMAEKEENPTKDAVWSIAERRFVLEEERWLLQQGINNLEMREEIYAIVMKQLTKNPRRPSKYRGWQLFSVLVVTFPPSERMEPHVRSFLAQAGESEDELIRKMVICKYLRMYCFASQMTDLLVVS